MLLKENTGAPGPRRWAQVLPSWQNEKPRRPCATKVATAPRVYGRSPPPCAGEGLGTLGRGEAAALRKGGGEGGYAGTLYACLSAAPT